MNNKLYDTFKKQPGIYIIHCNINNKYYIGESINIFNRMKCHVHGTSQLIHHAIKKHGIENFTVEIYYLPSFQKQDLIILEEQLIIKFNSIVPYGYNIVRKAVGITGFKHSTETKKLMSDSAKKKPPVTEETRKKQSEFQKNRLRKSFSEDHMEKFFQSRPKVYSEESKRKMSESQKKVDRSAPRSEETRLKISIANTGKSPTPQTREKLSNINRGKKLSEETKSKMRASMLQRMLNGYTPFKKN